MQVIDYVTRLRERAASKASATSYTRWAMILALAYLIDHSVGMKAIRSEAAIVWGLGMFTCIWAIVSFGESLIQHFPTKSLLNLFDFRIHTLTYSNWSSVIEIAIWFAPPALSAWWFLDQAHEYNSNMKWVLWVDIIYCVSNIAIVLILATGLWVYRKKRGLPAPIELSLGVSKIFHDETLPAVKIIWVALVASNVVALGMQVYYAGSEFASQAFRFGLFGFATLWIAEKLLDGNSDKLAEARISRIERDAVLEGLTEKQIRERLSEELLGESLGGWFNKKLTDIKHMGDDYLANLQKWKTEIVSLEKVAYKSEKIEQLDELVQRSDDAENNFELLIKKRDKLIKSSKNLEHWISGAQNFSSSWPEDVNNAIIGAKKELFDIVKKVTVDEAIDIEAMKDSIKKTKVRLKSIKK